MEQLKRHEIWFDKDGAVHAIKDMDQLYIEKVHKYLVRTIVAKVGALDDMAAAREDEEITQDEFDDYQELIRKDLLILAKDATNIRREITRRKHDGNR